MVFLTYDQLNRIAFAWTSGALWGERFEIDPWGSLNKIRACQSGDPCYGKPQGENLDQSSSGKNQFNGFCYDAAGNLNGMSACPVSTYLYDAENRLKSTAGVNYTYDGDGKRVKKDNGKLYWTGTGSDPLTETDLAGNPTADYVFFNNKRIARVDLPSGVVHFYFSDHLGSASVITSADGTTIEQESDYYPYGGERVITAGVNNYKFTGKEQDSESGLDNFGARYYSSAFSRFITVDPSGVSAVLGSPQSWNRYAHAYNNPLRYVDHNGKWPQEVHERIIDLALPGLSPQQRQVLKDTSKWVDRIPGGQTKAHNHEHAMKAPGEDPARARAAIEQNIQNHEQAAQRAQGGTPKHASQINNTALGEFGQAGHTVTDRTSPAHTDAKGNPRDWNGLPVLPGELQQVEQHNAEEAAPTPDQLETAIVAYQEAFRSTFGDAAFQDATTIVEEEKEGVDSKSTGKDGTGAKNERHD